MSALGSWKVMMTTPVGPQARVELNAMHCYSKPGTYFAVLRAASQRDGNTQTPYARIQNLARVRVVVR